MRRKQRTEEQPDLLLRTRAETYLQDVTYVKQGYDAHRGHKVLVRYEDLRADTLETIECICLTLELPASKGELATAVEKYSWEYIPEKEKGSGKARRKATSGVWREDLSPEQAELIERKTSQILDQFYAEG